MELGPYLILGLLEGLVTAAVLSLMALGLSLVFGVMRVVNVAHGEFFMVGAVLAWIIANAVDSHPAVNFLAALLLAPPATALLAAIADRLVLKRVAYDPERTIVATIGLLYIIQQVTLMTYGPMPARSRRLSTTGCRSRLSNGPKAGWRSTGRGALAPPATSLP